VIPSAVEEEEWDEEKKETEKSPKGEEGNLSFLKNKLRKFSEHTGKTS
jgi:hypothetical protein